MRQNTWAAAATLDAGNESASLLNYISASRRKAYADALKRYEGLDEDESRQQAADDMKKLLSSREFTGLVEIHPGWIWEAIKHETPRIIGVILRYLPSHQTRYVLEHMPTALRNELPPPLDAFRVPPSIVAVIRGIFQSHFLPMHLPRRSGSWRLEHLPYLSEDQLGRFFERRGLLELALALSSMPQKAHKLVMNRLSLAQARFLKTYLDEYTDHYDELRSSAMSAVLDMELEGQGGKIFLKHLGMRACAKGVGANEAWTRLVMQRLEPSLGYVWRRFLDEASTDLLEVGSKEKELSERLLVEMMHDVKAMQEVVSEEDN